MKPANIFDSIPENLEHEAVDLLVQNGAVRLERIVSKGHTSPDSGWYDQEKDEWVIVLKGAAIIVFEKGEDIRLETGDHLIIPAHARHKVTWTDPESETVWLAMHYWIK